MGKGSKRRPMQIHREQFEKNWDELFPSKNNKVAITKGCPNSRSPCFCTGACQEVVGYREKHPLEQ